MIVLQSVLFAFEKDGQHDAVTAVDGLSGRIGNQFVERSKSIDGRFALGSGRKRGEEFIVEKSAFSVDVVNFRLMLTESLSALDLVEWGDGEGCLEFVSDRDDRAEGQVFAFVECNLRTFSHVMARLGVINVCMLVGGIDVVDIACDNGENLGRLLLGMDDGGDILVTLL